MSDPVKGPLFPAGTPPAATREVVIDHEAAVVAERRLADAGPPASPDQSPAEPIAPARLPWQPDDCDGWTLDLGGVLELWISAEYDEDCPNTYAWQVRGLRAELRGFASTRESCERESIAAAASLLHETLAALGAASTGGRTDG